MSLSTTPIVESHIKIGERVETHENLRGTCRYVGAVKELGSGIYVGVELDDYIENGHDGSMDGHTYFECTPGHGQFVVIEQCTKIDMFINGYINEEEEEEEEEEQEEEEQEEEDGHVHASSAVEPEPAHVEHDDDNADVDDNRHEQQAKVEHIHGNEVNAKQASSALSRKFRRRPSQTDLEKQGVVPPNYFSDPMQSARSVRYGHEMVSSNLEEWLPQRPPRHELESHIVPTNYFEDPMASTKGKSLVKEMISSNLEEFHVKRPTLDELQMRNIIPAAYIESMEDSDTGHDHDYAQQQQLAKQRSIQSQLNEKLSNGRRPTITDLGDMHIIPHDYLDNLLEDAVANHQRKQSRMEHVQDRLQKHLPEPVAHTLAKTLLTSVQDDDDHEHDHMHPDNHPTHSHADAGADAHAHAHDDEDADDDDEEDDDEWQISFVYEPMESFVPMNAAQKDEVSNTLERRLSLRPSKQQIEVWGFVPPQYFESPEQSFLRQALGREIALDLLEGFLPHREDIYNLTNRGIMHPDFITQDHEEAVKQQHQRKKSVMDELNSKLDPTKRPSIVQLGDKGLIPDNWLLDLYGLADKVRKRHHKMESAVSDLRSQLNVPPVLADVVARDVLDEIETVDPYLHKDEHANQREPIDMEEQEVVHQEEEEDEDDDDDDGDDDDDDEAEQTQRSELISELQHRVSELQQAMSDQGREIASLRSDKSALQREVESMRESHQKYLSKIHSLENKQSLIVDQTQEIARLREEHNAGELHRLDAKAIEMDLTKERTLSQKLREEKNGIEHELLQYKFKCKQYEMELQQNEEQKLRLIETTNQQIDKLREYVAYYQKYFDQQQKQKEQQSAQGLFSNVFG